MGGTLRVTPIGVLRDTHPWHAYNTQPFHGPVTRISVSEQRVIDDINALQMLSEQRLPPPERIRKTATHTRATKGPNTLTGRIRHDPVMDAQVLAMLDKL